MARVKTNPVFEQVRGKVGDLVFKRYGDRVIMARKPDLSDQKPTEAQLAQREQVRQAALYGKMVMADPETKSLYEDAAQAKGVPVFSLAVADFFNAPSVDEVNVSGYSGKVGDCIEVRASDDFQVTGVTVAVAGDDGTTIESGAATETPAKSGHWTYHATQEVPTGTTVRITVTATDRPGHTGSKVESK